MQRSTAHLVGDHEATVQALKSEALKVAANSSPSIPLPFAFDPSAPDPFAELGSTGDSGTGPSDSIPPVKLVPPAQPKLSDLGIHIPPLDVKYEAGKVPLDLAIYHSIQCSTINASMAGTERLKKMLSCILVVGGTALTPGMLGALDSRSVPSVYLRQCL